MLTHIRYGKACGQVQKAGWSYDLDDQEEKANKNREQATNSLKTHLSDPLPPARLHFLKVL